MIEINGISILSEKEIQKLDDDETVTRIFPHDYNLFNLSADYVLASKIKTLSYDYLFIIKEDAEAFDSLTLKEKMDIYVKYFKNDKFFIHLITEEENRYDPSSNTFYKIKISATRSEIDSIRDETITLEEFLNIPEDDFKEFSNGYYLNEKYFTK